MSERKQTYSMTLDRQTVRTLAMIAAREANYNKSAAFRLIVAEAGAARGLCKPQTQSVMTQEAPK